MCGIRRHIQRPNFPIPLISLLNPRLQHPIPCESEGDVGSLDVDDLVDFAVGFEDERPPRFHKLLPEGHHLIAPLLHPLAQKEIGGKDLGNRNETKSR